MVQGLSLIHISLGRPDCERLNKQLKAQLAQKGINVYYGQEGAGDFPDYTAAVIDQPELIYRGLTQLMSTIQKFPDGFFNDLLSDEVRGIDIYLCGAFTPINPQWGIDTASAFAVVYNLSLIHIYYAAAYFSAWKISPFFHTAQIHTPAACIPSAPARPQAAPEQYPVRLK